MKIKPAYIKWLVSELESPLTYAVEITRNLEDEKAIVITISQRMSTADYGTPEMRKEIASPYMPMDLAPGEKR